MSQVTLKYAIHVSAPRLTENRETGSNKPVVMFRERDNLRKIVYARGVVINAPCHTVHDEKHPLPGTKKRAVCWVETDGPVVVYTENKGRMEEHVYN